MIRRLPPSLLVAALLGGLGLSACGGSSTSSYSTTATDPLTFSSTTIPAAHLDEDFKASMLVSGGVGPYAYRVASGTLPPGLSFSGGTLSGKPTKAGTYRFSIEANDANLSNKVAEYTINVTDLPSLALEPTLPPGEIRGVTRVPLVIKAPRQVRAARVTWDLGPDVQVQAVEGLDNATLVVWKQSGKLLTVDMGFKAVPRTGAQVALVTVKPLKPVTLASSNFWYESRDGKGTLLSEKTNPALARTAAPAENASAANAASSAVPASTTIPLTTDQTKLPSPASGTPATTPTVPIPAAPTSSNSPDQIQLPLPTTSPVPGSGK